MIGRIFDRLTVVARVENGPKGHLQYLCHCCCGAQVTKRKSHLLRGESRSCGCLQREKLAEASKTHGQSVGGRTSEYIAWCNIKERCNNQNASSYYLYGGRGIRVCDEWLNNFQAFLDYMGPKPTLQHSIDRYPDNDGNYEPGNVRWATASEQARHKRNNRVITIGPETKHLSEWSEISGNRAETIASRFWKLGWNAHDAVFKETT